MISFSGKSVLVLAPHTDDGEFGCGWIMGRLCREGSGRVGRVYAEVSEVIGGMI